MERVSVICSICTRLTPATLKKAVREIWHPIHRETMVTAYPLISDLLARIIVLPASSAEAERVFSSMNRIKSPLRNRLATDYLIQISMIGPDLSEWNPIELAKTWETEKLRY